MRADQGDRPPVIVREDNILARRALEEEDEREGREEVRPAPHRCAIREMLPGLQYREKVICGQVLPGWARF